MRERIFSPQATRRPFPGVARKHELASRDRYQAGVWEAENKRPLVERPPAEQAAPVDDASVAILVALLYYRRIKLQEDELRMEEAMREMTVGAKTDIVTYRQTMALMAIAAYQLSAIQSPEPAQEIAAQVKR